MNVLIFNLRTDASDDVLGFTTAWINAIAKRVNRVVVVTMHAGLVDVENNVKVLSVGRERGYSEPRRAVEFYRCLLSVLRDEAIDVCFAHMMPLFAVMGWPLLRLRGIPIVMWYAHGHIPLLVRVATILVDRVVASGATGFRLKTRKLRVIGQGIDIERFVPAERIRDEGKRRLVLVTIGRISRVKRLDVIVHALQEAIPQARDRGVEIVLRVFGKPLTENDKIYAEELGGLVGALDLHESVQFLDAVPFSRVQDILCESDIFVNASDTNSLDKAILEAMSCGVPVVTSNIAFEKVIVGPAAAMCLFRRGESSELAERLLGLVGLPERQRRLLGLELRKLVVQEHSLESLSMKLVDMFGQLAEASSSRMRGIQ